MAWAALVLGSACSSGPAPWDGPQLTEPRTSLTVDELQNGALPPLLDLTFLARPDWASGDGAPATLGLRLETAPFTMDFPATRDLYAGEELFPAVTLELVARDGLLIPAERSLVVTSDASDSLWDVLVGTGASWREADDGDWSRASFPLGLVDRFFNQVRNCVATFVYRDEEVSDAYVQCSQETADAQDQQLGDLRALVPATWTPSSADPAALLQAHAQAEDGRLPSRPLSEWDENGAIGALFDRNVLTSASTSVGAVYADGTLWVHPARTRHGLHPYPAAMRHGVYSVTKTMAGALAMLHLAQRYGDDEVFGARIVDFVPGLAGRAEWADVTFADALDMATGTRGGEGADLLYEPLVLAENTDEAIANIAALGDGAGAPGEVFTYATTNTFVLSVALQRFVQGREGDGVTYWDLVRDGVLEPIGAEGLNLLHTREAPEARIPYLGFGARVTLDQAAKIAVLMANDGTHDGAQLLHQGRLRAALGQTDWDGLRVNDQLRYRHSFWSRSVVTGTCRAELSYMEGHGSNHIVFLPSGAIVFRFMDEGADDLVPLVRSVERVRSSCD